MYAHRLKFFYSLECKGTILSVKNRLMLVVIILNDYPLSFLTTLNRCHAPCFMKNI